MNDGNTLDQRIIGTRFNIYRSKMKKVKQMRSVAMLAALAAAQSAAMAQSVTVTYGPDVTPVPTLSEWGMIILATVLAGFAAYAIRKNAGSKTVLSIVLAAMVSFSAFSGSNWLNPAWANGFTTYFMTSATGGQLSVPPTLIFAYVHNSTDRPQRIISITPQYGPPEAVDGKPACVPGMVLAPNTACTLRASNVS